MTPKKAAQAVDTLVLQGLNALHLELARRSIVSDLPYQMWVHAAQDFSWWMLVYPPVPKQGVPPEETLDVIVKLEMLGGGGLLTVDLIKVRGEMIDSYQLGSEFTDNVPDLKEQAKLLTTSFLNTLAGKIESYIEEGRKKRPRGPREWSPRWDLGSVRGLNFEFGPFQVSVDISLGEISRPWGGPKYPTYVLVLWDGHGHFFEAAWADVDREGPEAIAQRLIILFENAQEERDFAQAFSGGYGRHERNWRYREALRIKEAVQEFLPAEVTKAAAIAIKKLNYRMWKGPRDWSPIEEIPE